MTTFILRLKTPKSTIPGGRIIGTAVSNFLNSVILIIHQQLATHVVSRHFTKKN